MALNLFQSVQAPLTVASGTTTLVPAVPGARIRLVSAFLIATAAGNFNFQSHITTSKQTGVAAMAINGILVLPYSADGWFLTLPGEALDIVTTAAFAGSFNYVQV